MVKWSAVPEILKMVTGDNAELLALSGPRTPYDGEVGVVEKNAFADLILVEGDPLADLNLVSDAERTSRSS